MKYEKFELVSLSVAIGGQVIRKGPKSILSTKRFDAGELEAAYAAGYIKPVGTKAKTPKEVIDQYKKELKAEADEKESKEKQEEKKPDDGGKKAKTDKTGDTK
jgi:hypothetical protein